MYNNASTVVGNILRDEGCQSNDFLVERRTRSYRQKLLELTLTSKTNVAWECAQHALDTLWQGSFTNGSTDEADERNVTATMASASSPLSSQQSMLVKQLQQNGTAIQYGCQTCGHMLHPGWQGTSLRVEQKRRSKLKCCKTLRRRRQRKRKLEALAKLKAAKDTNRLKHRQAPSSSSSSAFTSGGDNNDTTDLLSKKEVRVVLLQDDPDLILDRHHLAIRCGRCHSKVCLKGPKKPNSSSSAAGSTTAAATTKAEARNKPPKTNRAPNNSDKKRKYPDSSYKRQGQISRDNATTPDENDFLKLPPAVGSKPAISPVLANSDKKTKRKKKPEPKKENKLMSFLSSLND